MKKRSVLIVDDDDYIGNVIEEALENSGYQVWRAYSGTEALYAVQDKLPDLIILNLMLPGMSGQKILPLLKGIPVIVLSARNELDEKAELLLQGASDYLTKPFYMKELLARIEVQFRIHQPERKHDAADLENQKPDSSHRNQAVKQDEYQRPSNPPSEIQEDRDHKILVFDDLRLDPLMHQVTVNEKTVHLTPTEFLILQTLMENIPVILTRIQLVDMVSETISDCTESSLKTHISHLRSKLSKASEENRDYIETVWGIGFRIRLDYRS